jgi:hypothetical protein
MPTPTTTPVGYNPSLSPIPGTTQVGNLSVGISDQEYSGNPGGITYWMSPDQDLGYVIAKPIPSGNQPFNPSIGSTSAYIGFNRTPDFTDSSFISLAESISKDYGSPQIFISGVQASTWLTSNGFWNTYVTPILSLDAGNTGSYPGSGTIWTDLIGGKTFILTNGPVYSSDNGGKIIFDADNNQYAISDSSLPSLQNWTVAVWHYYTGTNNPGPYGGNSPCIIVEKWPNTNGVLNYALGSLADNNPNLSAGFFDGDWEITPSGYILSENNWYYIVGTYDGSTINLYVNSELVAQSDYVGSPSAGEGGIVLMRRWDDPPGGNWGGDLSTVDIYDRALDSSKIIEYWNSTKSRYGL